MKKYWTIIVCTKRSSKLCCCTQHYKIWCQFFWYTYTITVLLFFLNHSRVSHFSHSHNQNKTLFLDEVAFPLLQAVLTAYGDNLFHRLLSEYNIVDTLIVVVFGVENHN